MEKNVIITISRQFGSNGREIARKLAEYLDISYYNKEILEKIAVNMGVCADFFKDQNQDANGLFTSRLWRNFRSREGTGGVDATELFLWTSESGSVCICGM